MEYSFEGTKFYTRLCLLGGIAYPAWSLFLHIFAPHRFDDPVGRIVVGVVFLLVFAFQKKLGSWVIPGTHIAATLCMVHFSTMIARGGAENSLLFGGLITSTALFLGFLNHPRAYLVYVIVVAVSIVVFTKAYGVFDQSIRFTGQIILIDVVKIFVAKIFRSHSRLIRSLREERTELLQKQKDLIVGNLKDAQSVFASLSEETEKLPENFQLRNIYRPAADAGGDWISHYYSKEKGWLVAAVGDVTGHDLISSLVTIAVAGAARGTFESLSAREVTLKELVDAMAHAADQAVRHSGIKGKSMSAGFVGIDLNSGQGYYVSCGHLPLVLKNGEGANLVSTPPSNLLGEENFLLESQEFEFKDDSELLLYTDGLIENPHKALSIAKLLRMSRKSPNMFNELKDFTADFSAEDDLAFFVIERKAA